MDISRFAACVALSTTTSAASAQCDRGFIITTHNTKTTADCFCCTVSTSALDTIDHEDGTPTLVGTSGLSLAAIGGIDFCSDGSTSLLSSGRDLFIINTNALSFKAPVSGQTPRLSWPSADLWESADADK